MTKTKTHTSLNGHSQFSVRIPTYGGVLGAAWFAAQMDGADAEAIQDEAAKRAEYIESIKKAKINIILSHNLEFEKVVDNVLHFRGEDNKSTYHYEFYAYPNEYPDIEKRLSLEDVIK